MMRTACALVALAVFVGLGSSADQDQKAVKAQMVKGTIKSANPATGVLVVNQKLANGGVVDRELTITDKVQFSITNKDGTEEVSGKDGLKLLTEAQGASVQVKCDKDVNVLKVTVKISK
jgi:hypothetical protein